MHQIGLLRVTSYVTQTPIKDIKGVGKTNILSCIRKAFIMICIKHEHDIQSSTMLIRKAPSLLRINDIKPHNLITINKILKKIENETNK